MTYAPVDSVCYVCILILTFRKFHMFTCHKHHINSYWPFGQTSSDAGPPKGLNSSNGHHEDNRNDRDLWLEGIYNRHKFNAPKKTKYTLAKRWSCSKRFLGMKDRRCTWSSGPYSCCTTAVIPLFLHHQSNLAWQPFCFWPDLLPCHLLDLAPAAGSLQPDSSAQSLRTVQPI